MSKRRNRNKKKDTEVLLGTTVPVPTTFTFTPEPEYPQFRYLTHYVIADKYGTWGDKTGKQYIRSQERTLQYKKSKDGDWYDIPEESTAKGPNDTPRNPWDFSWF